MLAKLLLVAALAATTPVQAQTWTWINPAGGNFSVAANWDLKSAPASSGDTMLMFDLSASYSVTNDLVSGLTLSQLTFSDSSGAVNVSGTNFSFSVSSSFTGPEYDNFGSNSVTIANSVNIMDNDTMNWNSAGDTTLNGTLVLGTGVTLVKDYPGRLILTQPLACTNANDLLYIADGTLQTRSVTYSGGGSGNVYIGYNGVSGNTAQRLLGQDGDTQNRRCFFSGLEGTTNIVGGANTSGTVQFQDWFNAQSSSDTKSIYYTAAPGGAVSVLNLIGGAALSVTKLGGGTVIITSGGANSNPNDGLAYSGTTTIRAGTLQLNADAVGTGGNGYGGSLGYNTNAVQLGDSLSLPTDQIALLTYGNNRLVVHPLSVNPYGASITIGASDQLSSCQFSGPIQLFTNLTVSAPDTNGVGVVTISGDIADGSGANSVNIQGPGRVNFAGINTYGGSTIVSSGTLQLTAPAPAASCISNSVQVLIASNAVLDVSSTPGFTLASGQTLKGVGTVNGAVTAGHGATLAVGWDGSSALGAMANLGNLTLAGNVVFRLNRAASPNSDQVRCSGAVVYGGTLTLTNVGSALQAGDSFTLFPTPGGGISQGFSAISPASPGTGLAWDFSKLSSGIVAVVAANTTPTISPPLANVEAQCGQNAAYTAFANGSGTLYYQWSVNGNPIAGATTPNFTITNIHSAGDVYTVSVLVTNALGHATSSATVTVVDTLPPVVTVLGANPLTIPALSTLVDPGATALDQCAGVVPITTNSAVNTSAAGTYTITYSATDPSGNTGLATRTVNVTPLTAVWAAPVSGLWTTPANWQHNVAPTSDAYQVDFNSVDVTNEVTVSLDSPATVVGLTFGDTDTSTPGGWTLDNHGNPANLLTLAYAGEAPSITVNELAAGEAVTLSATIAGSGGMTKLGAGQLNLTATNTYSGGSFIGEGTVAAGAASLPGNLFLSNNVTMIFDEGGGSGTITGQVQVAAGASVVCYFTNGDTTLTQPPSGPGFSPYIDDGSLITRTLTGGQNINVGYYSADGGNCAFLLAQDGDYEQGRVWFGQAGVDIIGGANTNGTVYFSNWMDSQGSAPVYFTAAAGGTVNINNNLIGNAQNAMVKIGAGALRMYSGGANSNDKAYAGGTTVRAGTLIIAADADGTADPSGGGGSLGYNDLPVELGDSLTQPSDTPTLVTEGANRLVTHEIDVNAYGAGTTIGANDGGSPVFSGPIKLATNLQLLAQGPALVTLSGGLSDGGAGARLTKLGTGKVTLTAPSSYSGGTVVLDGTLDVQSDGGLGSGKVAVGDGATLILENGVANSYLASTADLLLSGSPVINLNFRGTDTIASLSLDGGATYAAVGTWGSPSSGAAHADSRFTGTGGLQVTSSASPAPIATQLGLVSASNPSYYGTPVTFTATVSAPGYLPSGAVQFLTNGVPSGAPVALDSGMAVVALTLPEGTNTVSAQYPGNGSFTASSPASLKQAVIPAPAGYNQITRPALTNGVYASTYQGIPNAQYAVDMATSLHPPISWTAVVTNQASATGVITFTYTPEGPEGYYRVRYVP